MMCWTGTSLLFTLWYKRGARIDALYSFDRGSKLDDVSAISQNLASESKKYNWGAKQMSMLVSDNFLVLFVLITDDSLLRMVAGMVEALGASHFRYRHSSHRHHLPLCVVN